MDKCPKCGSALRIGRSYYTFRNDDTPKKPTEAYTNLEKVCANKECKHFAGEDLNNPNHVVHTAQHIVH